MPAILISLAPNMPILPASASRVRHAALQAISGLLVHRFAHPSGIFLGTWSVKFVCEGEISVPADNKGGIRTLP